MLLFACSSEEVAEQQKRSTQLLSYQSIFIANWHQTYHGNFMSLTVLRCIEQYFIQCYTGEKEHAHAHSHSVSLFPYLAGGCTKRCYEKSSVESDLCVVYQLFCCWVGYLLFLSEEARTMDEKKISAKMCARGTSISICTTFTQYPKQIDKLFNGCSVECFRAFFRSSCSIDLRQILTYRKLDRAHYCGCWCRHRIVHWRTSFSYTRK